MVAKIGKGSSLHGALSYNQEKVKEQQAKIIFSNRVMMNRDGSVNMYLANQSFVPYLDANKNTEKPVLHISINPHPEDKVSDEMYSEIAQAYMQKIGLGDQPYLVYKHEDLDRQHIHIVTVNVDENGKKIGDSNNFYQSKKITRELEKTYNLHTAEKKEQSEDIPTLKRINYESGDIKKQIANISKSLIKNYRFQSVNEFRALLSLYGVTVEEVKGEIKGKDYSGLVYSAINEKDEKVGTPIKASVIGKSVGYDALQSRLKYSTKYMKEHKVFETPKLIVGSAINSYTDKRTLLNDLAPNIEYVKDMDDCKMASGLNTFEALNIIDFYPVPHHTNFPFAKAVEKIIAKYESKINLYPITNSQVILVEKDNIRVVGK